MINNIAVGIVKNNNGSGSSFQNSIIEITSLLLSLDGTTLTLGEASKWWIGGVERSNITEISAATIPSTGLVRDDRVLLDKSGNMIIQPGIAAFSGGTSYLRPYDQNEFVELTVLKNDNGAVVIDPATTYQFTEPQKTALLALIYLNSINTISLSAATGERGIAQALSVFYNMQTRDDVFTAASINNGIGSVIGNINTGTQIASGGSASQNKTWTLALGFTRNGVTTTENKTATYTTYVPQFAGVSASTDFANLAAIVAASLQKFVQASNAISKQSSPAGQYIWFVSTKNNATILDQNNFSQTVGTWGDGTSEFYQKALVITLADATTETVYLYRSRQVKTLTNFTYKIQ